MCNMEWSKINTLILTALTYLKLFKMAEGLTCYSCNWSNDMGHKGCQNSPPPSKYLIECNEPQCWKRVSYAKGREFVQRFCVANAQNRNRCTATTIFDEKAGEDLPGEECYCDTPGCNASPPSFPFVTFSAHLGVFTSPIFASTFLLISTIFNHWIL